MYLVMVRRLFILTLLLPFQSNAVDVDISTTGLTSKNTHIIYHWIEHGLRSVEGTIGTFPFKRIKFNVLKSTDPSQSVPWAQVIRGAPNEINLYIDINASLSELIEDWTLYHEISHLYLPYLDYPSFWLNEGFATYVQYIAMLKSGVLGKRDYLKRVRRGLQSGAAMTKKLSGNLSYVSANMWQLNAYKRVYWTGAAFFMEVDKHLIQSGISLFEVIATYSDCCLMHEQLGIDFIRQLDIIAQSDIFYKTYKRYYKRQTFPLISQNDLNVISSYYTEDQSFTR
ncbi:hypothetical protein [Thalassotalea aquiviva]|uniref:hypothetical protein n=1 Tax=Thalassotalea aquiviva TaxID=3242415 RepID=UPI00352A93AA